jgi:putative hydrolase of the HAD superfamily
MCDLDDTLVVRAPAFRACAEGFLGECGRLDLLDWFIEHDRGGYRPRDEFWSAVHEQIGDAVTVEVGRDFQDRLAESYRIDEEGRAALAAATRDGWSVAILTNGPTAGQRRKIAAAGLDELVEAVCISEEVGAAKPDPVIFRTAAARAGVPLDGAWMIGDNLDTDIAGGQAVGAQTVWVRPDREWVAPVSDVRPDHTADSFTEAVRWVLDATAWPADEPAARPAPGSARASGSRC